MAEAGCKVGSNALWVGFSLSQAGAKAVGDVVPAASSENMEILLGSGNENSGLLEMLNSVLPD